MKNILLLIAVIVAFYSCDNEDYLIDGGISKADVGTTTFKFLETHSQLDTLAILLKKSGLDDDVDGTTTIFAPCNQSINNYLDKVLEELRKSDPLAEYTIDDIPTDTLTKYIGGYIFNEKITREDLSREGKVYTAINGEERRLSLEPTSDYENELSSKPEFVYYTYKFGDSWDFWDKVKDDKKVIVKTSNLVSTNGVIHVLQGNYTLFNYESKK